MKWQDGQGMVPTYYDYYEYGGGHDPGYEADLEAFVHEAKAAAGPGDEAKRFVRQPGEPLWQFSQRIDGELKLSMAELDEAEREDIGRHYREYGDQEAQEEAHREYEEEAERQLLAEPLPRVLEVEESAEPAPDPTRLPDGTPHPNPLLAERGWQAQGGWYVRQRQADREPGE